MTEKTKIEHDGMMFWPNDAGYTPCSHAYVDKLLKQRAIFDPTEDMGSTDDLPPELYQEWHQLQSELDTMMLEGHVGKGVRFQ